MALSKLNLQQLKDVCQEENIDHSGLRRKKELNESINEVREARKAAVEDDDGEEEAEFEEDAASVATGRSLKMAALTVVERSPRTSSDCDYS